MADTNEILDSIDALCGQLADNGQFDVAYAIRAVIDADADDTQPVPDDFRTIYTRVRHAARSAFMSTFARRALAKA